MNPPSNSTEIKVLAAALGAGLALVVLTAVKDLNPIAHTTVSELHTFENEEDLAAALAKLPPLPPLPPDIEEPEDALPADETEHKTLMEDTRPTQNEEASPDSKPSFVFSEKLAMATVFWIGEVENKDNHFIANDKSAWDTRWQTHYGGIDDPDDRCGYRPCAFVPKENPFYVALPYNDLDGHGEQKDNARLIPWYTPDTKGSMLKNQWVRITRDGVTCYGQWEDVGPFEEDDVAYVFGNAKNPKNTVNQSAGIDLSPALADCLALDGMGTVIWKLVDERDVPNGPWKTTITTR